MSALFTGERRIAEIIFWKELFIFIWACLNGELMSAADWFNS